MKKKIEKKPLKNLTILNTIEKYKLNKKFSITVLKKKFLSKYTLYLYLQEKVYYENKLWLEGY